MKVLKFGGTSVGTVSNILNVKQIVESVDEQVIVVVSALGGITDKLIKTSHMAVDGDIAYTTEMSEMIKRHLDMVYTIIPGSEDRDALVEHLNQLFGELKHHYDEVYVTRQLSSEKAAAIVSYGELLSSLIVNSLIQDSRWFDSRRFIKTEKVHHKYKLDAAVTAGLIRDSFTNCSKVSLVPGFISTDTHTGETTNLGRGGSDYTAAIIAAALDADVLEIWTDVDGFMTGDPRIITAARPIDELSYEEAIELCKFGAKVIYPPTIHPVCSKNIPILIKNTTHPEARGTIIARNTRLYENCIKGISFIKEISLITITNIGELTKQEVSESVLKHLRMNGINSFLLSKPDYHASVSIGVQLDDTSAARRILQEYYTVNVSEEHTSKILDECNLSMVTIVGDWEHRSVDVGNQLFGALASNGISVIASTLGATDTNLSFICECSVLCRAMKAAHDVFFQEKESYSTAS